MKKISLIIPIFNEEDNIRILYNEIQKTNVFNKLDEIICIDDCSTDNSKRELLELKTLNKKIKILFHEKNLGQSKCIYDAAQNTESDILITIDADCQNNPNDIEKLLNLYLLSDETSLVGGIRRNRKDDTIKKISSKIANFVRRLYLNDDCEDTGCSLKVFDKSLFLNLPFFDGIHRFLPALFKFQGSKNIFIDVDHRKRLKGISKYGFKNRFYKGIKDMIMVKTIIRELKSKL